MGTLSNKDQGISGHVYSVDENTVYLKNFTFSGTGSGTYSLAYYFLFFPIPWMDFWNHSEIPLKSSARYMAKTHQIHAKL